MQAFEYFEDLFGIFLFEADAIIPEGDIKVLSVSLGFAEVAACHIGCYDFCADFYYGADAWLCKLQGITHKVIEQLVDL